MPEPENRPFVRVSLAPHLVVRVAGLPFSALTALVGPRSQAQVALTLELEAWLNDAGERLCAALYEAVSASCMAPEVRRALVHAKRDIHNGRIPRAIDLVASQLAADQAALLNKWVQKSQRLHDGYTAGERLYQSDLDCATERLQQWARHPAFAKALALASAPLYEKLTAYVLTPVAQQKGRLRRLDRSLLMYLARAAAKTSPFSSFTAVARGEWQSRQSGKAGWEYRTGYHPAPVSRAAISQAQLTRLAVAAARDSALSPYALLRLNPTLTCERDRYVAYGCFDQTKGGRVAFTGERLVAVERSAALDWLLEMVREGCVTGAALKARAADLGTAAYVEAVLPLLIEAQVIEAYWPVADCVPDYPAALAIAMHSVPGDAAAQLREALWRLSDLTAQYPDSPADMRLHLFERISEGLWAACDASACDRAHLGPPELFEDAAWPGAVLRVDPALWRPGLEGLYLIERLLPLYDHWRMGAMAIRDLFVRRYGTEGTCTRLLDFCLAVQDASPFLGGAGSSSLPTPPEQAVIQRLASAFADGLRTAVRAAGEAQEVHLARAWLESLCAQIPQTMWSAPTAHSYLVQPLPSTGSFVVNEVAGGFVRQVARYAHLLDETAGRDFSAALRSYLAGALPAAQAFLELPGSFGFSANRRPSLAGCTLAYPGVVLADDVGTVVSWDDLVLRHCAQSDRLLLIHQPTGRELLPLNLCALTFQMLPRLFQCLSLLHPIGNIYLPLIEMLEEQLSPEARLAPRRYPRIAVEGAVLLRETWIIPSTHLPRRKSGTTDFLFACEVERWRRQMGLPQQVFIRTTLDPGGVWMQMVLRVDDTKTDLPRDMHRKPQYVDFASPALLQVFEKHVNVVESLLVIQEMLPTADDLLEAPTGHSAVSEWIVELSAIGR